MENIRPTGWSLQQQNILAWFETGIGNLVVRARAGTGKTTIIVEGVKHAPERNILLCAFNKAIATELSERLDGKGTARTLHSIGNGCVSRYWERLRIASPIKLRADSLTEQVCGTTAPDSIKSLVSKLHTKGREIAPHARWVGDLTDLAITFECEPDERWAGTGYDLRYVEMKALAAMELAATVKPVNTGIDFSDMIFLPCRNGWLIPQFDLVVVDEAQDMTLAQLEIAEGVCKGRLCVVGDDRQAIYGFRGADSQALDRLKGKLHAQEMGLNTTYRCAKSIVALAKTLVPDFQCGNTTEGDVTYILTEQLAEKAGPGDFVLSRLNAPLVSTAMRLLKIGKRACVKGRDIGKGLVSLVRKLRARSVPDFLKKVDVWKDRELHRLQKIKNTDTRQEAVKDQADMLQELAEGAHNVAEITTRIENLFKDGLGAAGMITCSSVHRAKGLEADRVFVLRNTLRAFPGTSPVAEDQLLDEFNITYVAITRAKQHLVWVS